MLSSSRGEVQRPGGRRRRLGSATRGAPRIKPAAIARASRLLGKASIGWGNARDQFGQEPSAPGMLGRSATASASSNVAAQAIDHALDARGVREAGHRIESPESLVALRRA
jgi:hypothetical protein